MLAASKDEDDEAAAAAATVLVNSYYTEVQPISIVIALAGGAPACPNTVATPKHQFYASYIAILTFFSVFSCQLSLYNGSCVKSSSAFARALFRACPSPSYSPAKGSRLNSRPKTRLPAITLDRVVLFSDPQANWLYYPSNRRSMSSRRACYP